MLEYYSNISFTQPYTSVSTLPLLTGYYIDSNTLFGVNTSSGIVDSTTYFVRIDTISDCLLLRVDLYILFYSTSQL